MRFIKFYRLTLAVCAVLIASVSNAQMVIPVVVPPFSGGGSSSLTASTTATSGCTDGGFLYSLSSLLNCGTVVTTSGSSLAGDSATKNWFNVTGTLPTTMTAETNGVVVAATGAGSSAFLNGAMKIDYLSGYTGTSGTYGLRVSNGMTSAGGVFSGVNGSGNMGLQATSSGTGSNYNIGVVGYGNSSTVIGMGGVFMGNYGGLTAVYSTNGTYILGVQNNVALSADNKSSVVGIANFSDNSATPSTTAAAAVVSVLDGAHLRLGNMVLTSGTMNVANAGEARTVVSAYEWTNAQVVALGAVTVGDITVATLPAKTVVKNVYVVILTPDSSANALTVACGRTSAAYIDYIVASDAKAAANTVYGDASAERGTNLTGYDLPSYTGTTAVVCHFIKTTSNLNTVTGSTGRVIIETSLVP